MFRLTKIFILLYLLILDACSLKEMNRKNFQTEFKELYVKTLDSLAANRKLDIVELPFANAHDFKCFKPFFPYSKKIDSVMYFQIFSPAHYTSEEIIRPIELEVLFVYISDSIHYRVSYQDNNYYFVRKVSKKNYDVRYIYQMLAKVSDTSFCYKDPFSHFSGKEVKCFGLVVITHKNQVNRIETRYIHEGRRRLEIMDSILIDLLGYGVEDSGKQNWND